MIDKVYQAVLDSFALFKPLSSCRYSNYAGPDSGGR